MGLSYKREGDRIVGRYIKASDKRVLDKVKLSTFSFAEISSTPVASLDNINSNIMRTDLHSEDEIHSVVREHESFDLELRNTEAIRPLLRPIDFTHEWNAIKERATKKRDLKMEDDDELEFEMALAKMRKDDAKDAEDDEQGVAAGEGADSIEAESREGADEEESGAFKFKREENTADIDGLGAQINMLSGEDNGGVNELASKYKKVSDVQGNNNTAGSQEPTAGADEFIPVDMQRSGSFDESESNAAEEYKSRINVEKEYARQLEEAMNAAKARGYEEGFAHGEEKAAIQVQQNATEVVNNLGQVVAELEGLKKAILDNTQENFYEIAQAVAESLVRREFSVNPKAFADVLRKAIDDFVPADDIKIAVHPDTFSKLMSIDVDGLKDKLLKDENMQPGDFRIESNLSVVDGNVKEMIRELLEQANLDIFADKDDKVG